MQLQFMPLNLCNISTFIYIAWIWRSSITARTWRRAWGEAVPITRYSQNVSMHSYGETFTADVQTKTHTQLCIRNTLPAYAALNQEINDLQNVMTHTMSSNWIGFITCRYMYMYVYVYMYLQALVNTPPEVFLCLSLPRKYGITWGTRWHWIL